MDVLVRVVAVEARRGPVAVTVDEAVERALADLRQNAGEASSRDLESLLQTLAQSAPDFNQLSFGPSEAVLRGFRPSRGGEAWQAELQQAGWSVQLAGEPPVLTLKARP